MRGLNNSSILLVLLVFLNIITLFITTYSINKAHKAKYKLYEKTLLILAFFLGGIGVLIGKIIFRFKDKYKKLNILMPFAIVANLVVIAFLFMQVSGIGVTRYNVRSERLPEEFDGFKILHMSDFHRGRFKGGVEALVSKAKVEKPNIIVLTGDFMDEGIEDTSSVSSLVSQLVKIAPVYSVSGNHDKWYSGFDDLQKILSDNGVKLLENTGDTINIGNSHINLFGISDPNVWDYNQAEKYVKKNMDNLKPEAGYNILLFHRANMFETVKTAGYQLVLSGHMHGGQFQIPFLGGLKSPHGEWFPKYSEGKWKEDGTTMIVSRGLGNAVSVPRLLNPPEIVMITLEKE